MSGTAQAAAPSLFLRSALILALLWAIPAQAETALIGLKRAEQASPWKAVGRLDMAGGGYCTATLIAPDLVLSAAHCTFDQDGTRRAPQDITFRVGFNEGRIEAERTVAQIALPEAYEYKGSDWIARIANDVVLLRLDTPIPTQVISPFLVEPRLLEQGEVSVVSYGRGRDSLPSLQSTCAVLRSYKGVMVMNCDTTFGSSGAPVFRRDGTRIRIASIVSGSVTISGVRRTTGMALPDLVTQLKSQLIAGASGPVPVVRMIEVGARTSGGAKFIRP